jgi:hypothetical protein
MKALTFDAVREIGLALPNTEEGKAWGTPVLRVNGTIFAGIPIHKSAEAGSLMLRVDFADRDLLIAEQPDVYYTAAHYENYPCVLVRFARINRDALGDLVRMAHRYAGAQRPKRRATKSPARKRRASKARPTRS